MEKDDWRQLRLAALAEKFGGNAELGRRLGYKDGAFVGQMVKGLRKITEKTIEIAEALPGCTAWFERLDDEEPQSIAPPSSEEEILSRAIDTVAAALRSAGPKKKDAFDNMFSLLTNHPDEGGISAQKIAELLRRTQPTTKLTDDPSQAASKVDVLLKGRGDNDGQGDSDSEDERKTGRS